MRRSMSILTALLLICLVTMPAMAKAKINIVVVDAPGVGFNDQTPAAPLATNPGTTIGEQRLIAFTFAANVWGSTLDSAADINIQASFAPLACTATTATLGSAGTIQVVFDFPGAEFPGTLYHTALANKLALQDLIPGDPGTSADDIRARFNGNLGNAGCLTGTFWYYGLDTNHTASQINLVTVLLHEFSHGLGFSTFTSGVSGNFLAGFPSIWDRYIYDGTIGKTWFDMTAAERRASAINPRRVAWIGGQVTDAVPGVLAPGVPGLSILAPASVAGHYEVGTASFGAALTAAGITGEIVVATDPSDAFGASTTDACSAITNPSAIAGKIALVDRGTCGFVVKAKNVQNAGAIAVLVADNAAGGPPAGLGGADPTITIPAVRITLPDGNAIKAALSGGPVTGTLLLDMSRLAGTDGNNHALLYTPNPFISGSSVSHYDQQEFPNQLMEPNINTDLTLNVKPPADLTLPLLRDIGWYADEDTDGVPDATDQCAGSDLTAGDIVIQGCDTTVENVLFTTGCTIRDLIKNSGTGVKNHGGFVSNMAHLGDALVNAGIISPVQKDALQSCSAKAK